MICGKSAIMHGRHSPSNCCGVAQGPHLMRVRVFRAVTAPARLFVFHCKELRQVVAVVSEGGGRERAHTRREATKIVNCEQGR